MSNFLTKSIVGIVCESYTECRWLVVEISLEKAPMPFGFGVPTSVGKA